MRILVSPQIFRTSILTADRKTQHALCSDGPICVLFLHGSRHVTKHVTKHAWELKGFQWAKFVAKQDRAVLQAAPGPAQYGAAVMCQHEDT